MTIKDAMRIAPRIEFSETRFSFMCGYNSAFEDLTQIFNEYPQDEKREALIAKRIASAIIKDEFDLGSLAAYKACFGG
jgi:hypothetical protein